ncbi:hypothetical protein [Hymenobacter pini]|nr:hypothetical protein [Hymenobacter pini]MCA8830525.1 hypothetical protein [Hymenobacter pini]
MSQPSTPAATPKRKRVSHRQSVAEFIAEANARKVKWVDWNGNPVEQPAR